MAKSKITFEEALAGLEKYSSDLRTPGLRLDEAIANFEKGIEYYNKCSEILNGAKQKVITYSKQGETDE